MDRRHALRLLAAGGAATAASSVVSSPVFADGASPAGIDDVVVSPPGELFIERQFGPSFGNAPNSFGAVQGNFRQDLQCAGGATRTLERRVSVLASSGSPLIVGAGIPLDTWTVVSGLAFVIGYRTSDDTSLIGGSLTVRVEVRVTCCRPTGERSWRCFQASGTATFDGPGNTTVTGSSSSNSLNCENPIPTCP